MRNSFLEKDPPYSRVVNLTNKAAAAHRVSVARAMDWRDKLREAQFRIKGFYIVSTIFSLIEEYHARKHSNFGLFFTNPSLRGIYGGPVLLALPFTVAIARNSISGEVSPGLFLT